MQKLIFTLGKMRLLLLLPLIGFDLLTFSQAGTYYDPATEAVVIDDTVTFDPSKFDRVPGEGDPEGTTMIPEGFCTTQAGGPGSCIPLRECFPYIDLVEGDAYFSNYIGEIINATEPCSEEGLVCCPNYNYQKLPSKKPPFLPQFPRPTPPSKNVTTTTTSTTTTQKPVEEEKKKRTCGTFQKTTEDLVVGGREARPGEFPWAVAMMNNGRQFCGGSLINKNWILTAAHCVQPLTSSSGVRVILGAHNLAASSEPSRQSRSLTKILYHRGFSMRNLQNDIALLQLSSPVEYTDRIQPICLNDADNLTYKEKVDLAGWGKTGNNGRPSSTLRTVNMALISPDRCRRTYQGTNAPPLSSGMICAGEQSPLKDACNGDSGGPLTLKEGDGAKQVGVVSWGIGCGEKPGVYTKVSAYLDWINKNSK